MNGIVDPLISSGLNVSIVLADGDNLGDFPTANNRTDINVVTEPDTAEYAYDW